MMKNLFYTIILLAFTNMLTAQVAQLPNYSFDEWEANDLYPANWSTYERIYNSDFGLAVKDTNEFFIGEASIRINTADVQGQIIPGLAILGSNATISSTGQIINDGVPYTERPDTIEVLYKYTSSVKDTGLVYVRFFNGATNIMDFPFYIVDTAEAWQLFTYPMDELYTDTINKPTIARAYLFNSAQSLTPLSTKLWVDGIFFYSKGNASTFSNPKVAQIEATVSPNPASDIVTITTESSIEGFRIMLFDGSGKMVKLQQGAEKTSINISDLPAGIYNLMILNKKQEPVYRTRITRI